jgi:hypothetical protein
LRLHLSHPKTKVVYDGVCHAVWAEIFQLTKMSNRQNGLGNRHQFDTYGHPRYSGPGKLLKNATDSFVVSCLFALWQKDVFASISISGGKISSKATFSSRLVTRILGEQYPDLPKSRTRIVTESSFRNRVFKSVRARIQVE